MKLPTDPNAPCPCPSGLTYGECHKATNDAADAELLDVAHREYARRWGGNSSAYDAQGLYRHLAAHLAKSGPLQRIIDVGCGRGEGPAALRELTGKEGMLVGIDENPDCLAGAAAHLGVTRPATRLVRVPVPGRDFDVTFVPGRLPPIAPVVLVQADMLLPDPEFEGWISALAPVDAVTMWFTGVHPARQFDRNIKAIGITDDRIHRMTNDLATLDLAGAVLRQDGLLHIVGRTMANCAQWAIDESANEMRALAEHGPFDVVDVEVHEYDEPTTGPRIAVGAPGIAGHQRYATSTILRRGS